MGIEEGEEIQTKGIDNLFNNIVSENFPNVEKERDIQVQEVYRMPNQQNRQKTTTKKTPPEILIIKTLNMQNKERILKAEKEKRQVTHKGKPIKITDFSTQILNARK
jgi:hypothetical protein